MTIALCIDDSGGMLFNGRRQSRDSLLIKNFIEFCRDRPIHIASFSARLFSEFADRVIVDDDFLTSAEEDDVCFVENADVVPFAGKIDRVVIYRWNRRYPSDFRFNLDMSGYVLAESVEFAGSSHDRITREVFVK